MKDYLLKREAELIAASEALDVAHDKAWKKGQTDIATAHVVGGSTVLAYAAINSDEVRTFDDTFCDDCEGECSVITVKVRDDFDIETDFFNSEEIR